MISITSINGHTPAPPSKKQTASCFKHGLAPLCGTCYLIATISCSPSSAALEGSGNFTQSSNITMYHSTSNEYKGNENFAQLSNITMYNSSSHEYNRTIHLNRGDRSVMEAELEKSMKCLDEIESLEYNWNGNKATPFSKEFIVETRKIISTLPKQPFIFPTARSSIQLEYEKSNGDYLELEFFEDGRFTQFSATSLSQGETIEIRIEDGSKVVSKFYDESV